MPRLSPGTSLNNMLEQYAFSILLQLSIATSIREMDDLYDELEDLLLIHAATDESGYLSSEEDDPAGRPSTDFINTESLALPETSFLAHFRMKQDGFVELTRILSERGGHRYWG